jgi:SAM-dependent methyltransferase
MDRDSNIEAKVILIAKKLYERRNSIAPEIFNKIYHDELVSYIPIEKQIADYYISDGSCAIHRVGRILDVAALKKGEYVLDLGCGIGTFTFNSARYTNLCIGVDYSFESLKVARKINERFPDDLYGRRYFVCADAAKLPFKEGCFDKIIAADFLEHLTKNQKISIGYELNRILKQNGIFIALTPNKISIICQRLNAALRKLFFNENEQFVVNFLTASHIGELTPFGAKKLCRGMGFCKMKFFYKRDEFYFPFGNRFVGRLPYLRIFFERVVSKIPLIRDMLSANILITASKK